MADYAPNATARLRLKYRGGLRNHAMTLRFNSSTPEVPAALITQINGMLGALSGALALDWRITSGEVAAQDSDVFIPVDVSAITVAPAGAAATLGLSPHFLSFQGKSMSGNRASIYIFGITIDPSSSVGVFQDYRITPGDEPTIGTALTALLPVSGGIVAIDGTSVFWNQYVNLGVHGHYQRKARN